MLAAFSDNRALDGTRLVLAMTATHDRRHGRVAGANLLKHYRTVACDLLERMGKAGLVKNRTCTDGGTDAITGPSDLIRRATAERP